MLKKSRAFPGRHPQVFRLEGECQSQPLITKILSKEREHGLLGGHVGEGAEQPLIEQVPKVAV